MVLVHKALSVNSFLSAVPPEAQPLIDANKKTSGNLCGTCIARVLLGCGCCTFGG